MRGRKARAFRFKLGRIARAQYQRRAFGGKALGDRCAEPEASAGDDRAPTGQLHDTRPTEIKERRLSDPSVAPRKRPASITTRPFIVPAMSSPDSSRNSGDSLPTTIVSAPLATEGASEQRRTDFRSSGRCDTCGSKACTDAPSFNSARISSTDGERRSALVPGL